MNFYFISPIGATSPGLFETFPETFQKEGHSIVADIRDADIAMFDSHSGYLKYDWDILHYVLERRMPVVYFDAFDYDCDSSKNWFGFNNWEGLSSLLHEEWGGFLNSARQLCPLIYFMRKMQTNADYDKNVFPFEYCMFPDHNFQLVSQEELTSRPIDICFIGAKSPHREEICKGLAECGMFNVDFQFTEERIPHNEWLQRARQAKFFLEADGGGIGSERPFQLMNIAPMLRQANLANRVNDWQTGWDCIDLHLPINTKRWWLDISMLSLTLNDPDFHYKIYQRGIERMNTFYSWEFRAKYILSIIKDNL